ncbi:type IV secretion system protein [Caulobacter sp.]|uniref:type IV secretion system protein n=1 Tax=Caulobacter sp. TaxID=78 RepID=UPI003BAA4DB4
MNALACPNPGSALVQGLIGSVDCKVHGLAQAGYATLSAPGSPIAGLLTALLTLYVAFIGYRLILGHGNLRIGDVTISVLKMGLVVALATNWALFQTLVYDTLFQAPAELGAILLGQLQGPDATLGADPYAGLQVAFDTLQKAAVQFAARAGGGASALQGGPGFAAFAVNAGGMVMLLSTLGLVLASKVVLAVLLAVAPLVAGLLLFEATRGVVEGWIKAMVALALAPMIATLALSLELAMLEPALKALAAMGAAQQFAEFDIGPAVTVLVLTLVFAAVLVLASIAIAVICAGIRLPRRAPGQAQSDAAGAASQDRYAASQVEPRSRATAIAAAAAALDHREPTTAASSSPIGPRMLTVVSDRTAAPAPASQGVAPLGTTYRRNPATRRTASGVRRDQ